MKIEFKFENGVKVKDAVTGLTGIINGAVIWLNGCIQYSVQPRAKSGETKKPGSWWIDEEQLEAVRGGILNKMKPKVKQTGGPSTRSDR